MGQNINPLPYWTPPIPPKIPGPIPAKKLPYDPKVLENIIGLPPQTSADYGLISNSMPIMEIIPSKPKSLGSVSLFSLVEDTAAYEKLLRFYGYVLSERPMKLAFMADSFPTETFTNTYSETFLDKFAGTVSQGAAELTQITGATTAGEALSKVLGGLERGGGVLGTFATGAKGVVGYLGEQYEKTAKGLGATGKVAGKTAGRFAGLASRLLGGYRPDMPMIWRDSGYTPSYTITVRLYNPVPSDSTMKERYIIGPLAAILLLALPRTDDGVYFNWPFFHQINVPGVFSIPAGYIGNVTVIKGGEQQQITYRQELSVVDVRIEIGSLFGTIVVGSKEYASLQRPTLKNYLDNLKSTRSVYVRDEKTGITLNQEDYEEMNENVDHRQNQGNVDVTTEPGDRVSTEDSTDENTLLVNQPTIT